MSFPCQIEEQLAQPTLVIRARTPVEGLSRVLGQAFGAIAGYLGELGQAPAGPPFAAYLNMDLQNLEVEIGFPVSQPFPGRGEIEPAEIPAGRQATCIHLGPYSEVQPAYGALTQYVEEQGLQATGAAYEFYLNDPAETPPHELMTRIVFPLAG